MRILSVPGLPVGGDQDVDTPTTAPAAPDLHQQITEALTELREARIAYQHCPSGDNQQIVEYAEWRLGRLLDRLPREEPCSSSD